MTFPLPTGRGTILVLGLLVVCACSRDASNEAPPRTESPLQLESRPSTIVIPIVASLETLKAKLNREVLNPLVAIDQDLDACIPAKWAIVCPVPKLHIKCRGFKCRNVADGCAVSEIKTKITPDISCRIKGAVTRGEIVVGGKDETLTMAMPVNIDISAKDIGGIIKSETATGSADVRVSATLDIDEEWNVVAQVTADYSWNDRIGVDILGQRITFASKVDPEIRKSIAEFQAGIPAQIEALGVKEKLSAAWEQGFSPFQLSENPPAWLRFTPGSVGYSGYRISDGVIRLSLMAEGVTETFLGPRPSDPASTPLPKLVKDLAPEGFEFYLPVLASYSALEQAAEAALHAGEEQVFDLPNVGMVSVTFEGVTVYQTTGGAVAIGVQLTANSPHEFFDTKGTIWLSALPEVDNENHIVGVTTFEIAGDTNNEAVDLLMSILRLPVVNDQLLAAMRYDFDKQYVAALGAANAALKRELAEDLFFDGEIEKAAVDKVFAIPEGLYLGLIVTGKATLQYTGSIN